MKTVTRINYTKAVSGVCSSTSELWLPTGSAVRVELNKNDYSYMIFNIDDNTVLDQGTTGGYQQLLRAVKNKLINLGVNVGREERNLSDAGGSTSGERLSADPVDRWLT